MRKFIPKGFSLPQEITTIIDECRGDIPRSKFVLRILEKHFEENSRHTEKQSSKNKKSSDILAANPVSDDITNQ